MDAIKYPKEIRNILCSNEQVLGMIQQSRWRSPINPDTIVATNQRLILCKPSVLGLKKQLEDFRYQDMANFKVNKGIFFASITIKQNFMSDDLVLENLKKAPLDSITRIIQEQINSNRDSGGPLDQAEVPLAVLKMRFAKGEISKDQFEEMKRLIN
ncbi:MAG: PH domain-containing protein [Dehalogenimonas sp.]